MGSPWLIPFGLMLFIAECGARPLYTSPTEADKPYKQPLQTFRSFNIAHRGSNGELPEETAAAYKRAIEEGADFIETDISSSKDGVLICFHDLILDKTTDVSSYKEFADRKRTYEVQGLNQTGFFTVDFTWKELQKLKTRQRYPFRDQQYNGKFPIITFKDYISIALNASRVVGIYPEIKNPVFINEHVKWPNGKKFEDMFVETLKKYRYKGSYLSKDWLQQPIFIQSFAPTSLVYIANLTDLPKLLLIDDRNVPTQDTNQTYQEITSDTYFDYIKQYVVGIGPWKDTIVPALNNNLQTPTDLVDRAHAHGLQSPPPVLRPPRIRRQRQRALSRRQDIWPPSRHRRASERSRVLPSNLSRGGGTPLVSVAGAVVCSSFRHQPSLSPLFAPLLPEQDLYFWVGYFY